LTVVDTNLLQIQTVYVAQETLSVTQLSNSTDLFSVLLAILNIVNHIFSDNFLQSFIFDAWSIFPQMVGLQYICRMKADLWSRNLTVADIMKTLMHKTLILC